MQTKYRLGRSSFRTLEEGMEKEWLVTNGIGGFANGSVTGANHRLFSSYLIASFHAPVDRKIIWSGTHEKLMLANQKEADLTAQAYVGETKEGYQYLNNFVLDVVPSYTYQADDVIVKKTIGMAFGKNVTAVTYEIEAGKTGGQLYVTPMFKFTSPGEGATKEELAFDMEIKDRKLTLVPPTDNNKRIQFLTSEGTYFDRKELPVSMATPNYLIEENTYYPIENRTGYRGLDNHATPYDVVVSYEPYEKKKFFVLCGAWDSEDESLEEYLAQADGFRIVEECKERVYGLMDKMPEDSFARRLAWSADHFIVERESTGLKTVLAGYPWFMDWGRDTMIALQGLTLCTGRFQDAREILESFSKYVKDGMIPNVFPNSAKEEPMYNTIDASLWYFYSAYKYIEYTKDFDFVQEKLYSCLKDIIEAYKNGTHFSIKMDEDGLVQGGSDLDQLTWMDVRVGDIVVTPRHGKAVEINALWYNALRIMEMFSEKFGEDASYYRAMAEQVKKVYADTFWNEEEGCLYDVLTKDQKDGSVRPNQIWVVSLPFSLLSKEQEKQIVDTVYEQLYTPYGMRSLSNRDAEYKKEYIGKLLNRDLAYHMGTSWGFISGGFITAYCKVNGYSKDAIERAEEMCRCFEDHMQDGCLNGIAEIFDGDFACTSRGCFNQAWSVGEVLRAYMEDVLPHKE